MEIPRFNLNEFECAKYARLVAKGSGAIYVPAPTWELGDKNRVISQTEGNLSLDVLIPGESIVIFHHPKSKYNKPERIGTHTAIYLGNGIFAHQSRLRQEKITYSGLLKRGFSVRQVLAPRHIII